MPNAPGVFVTDLPGFVVGSFDLTGSPNGTGLDTCRRGLGTCRRGPGTCRYNGLFHSGCIWGKSPGNYEEVDKAWP